MELELDCFRTVARGKLKLLRRRLLAVDFRRREERAPHLIMKVETELTHHVLGGEAQPRRGAAGRDVGAVGEKRDLEDLERRRGGVAGEGAIDGIQMCGRERRRVVVGAEAELGEMGPDAAPSARERAGARGGAGGVEAEEDDVQQLVGELANAVLAGAGAVIFSHWRRR